MPDESAPPRGLRHRGTLFRALDPRQADAPLSGEGARRHGRQFNPRGVAALYTSLSAATALAEANQTGALQPTLLVAFDADVGPLFDATDPAALAPYGETPASLRAQDWRTLMRERGHAPSQILAERLIAAGYAGLRVASHVRDAGAEDLNVVLWRWGADLPARLVLIDDEDRLAP